MNVFILNRGIWLCLVLLAMIGTIFLLVQIVIKITFPQKISTSSLNYNKYLTLPQMTFCNSNRIRKSYAEQNPIMRRLMYEWDYRLWSKPLYYFDNNITMYEQIMNMSLDGVDAKQMLKESGHQLENMILKMRTLKIEMSVAKYFTPTSTLVGMCYTLNGSKIKVEEPGLFDSLQLILNVEHSEYLFTGDYIPSAGIWVSVA